MKPVYLDLPLGALNEKIRQAEAILENCVLCPWEYRVDRISRELGFCEMRANPFVSSWGPHFGEERWITVK